VSALESTKAFIPKNPQTALNTVANIWEKFVGTGELSDNRLRPVIADRWLRCRELGINPLNDRAESVISSEEVENTLHCENLGISGKNVLDKMSDTVKDTGHIIVLADKSGRIIYSVGHEKVQKHLEKINFRPGSEWNEDIVGPNGVGTPLTLGHPELVMGSEHFCQGWQPWVCYGAPVHNPVNRSVLGCIDITGPADKVCVEAMALAISITQSIESDLSVTQLKKREELRLAFHEFQIKWPNNASLAIDEYGYIIDNNTVASSFAGSSAPILNQAIHLFFPEFTSTIQECLNDGMERECEMEINMAFTNSIHALIRPIKTKTGTSGCFILFIDKNNYSGISTSLQSNEDDLIRKTLIHTGGNISKAARILNIDRTTIYRRRKNWHQ
jgi:transcriptional regulator of acetoin/glycerol metabolism